MGETMLGNLSKIDRYSFANHLKGCQNFVHLPSYNVDRLKYGCIDAVGYNKRRFGSILDVALTKRTFKFMEWKKPNDC